MFKWLKRLKHGPARHISWRIFFEAVKRSGMDETPDTPLYYKVEDIETGTVLTVWAISYALFILWAIGKMT